ncbi:MAG: 50S ribosomal protein L25/general stress protein Ctc [Actinobacteria bacterium]|nr:50S ribosomal protein L25/general stress protein Ctc [Actinomycetota bacterium]MBI3686326.1 50S ribosomal protein L25/general stress protein Ctc [Actinomycetota bacterium]
MSEVRIAAESRTEFGKGAARRTRRSGKIPAVLYGHGTDPRHVALPAREFAQAIKRGGLNALLAIELDGGQQLALARQLQRDPVRGEIEHVDLLLVRRGEKVSVSIPVTLVGDPVAGGLVNHELTTVEVEAEATHLPDSVEVSIAGLHVGAHVTAGDLPLPKGATLVTDATYVVVSILAAPTAAAHEAAIGATETAATEVAGA